MTDARTFSWILLCVSEEGSTHPQISEIADGINHAIPTHHELQTSLRWLQEQGLVRKDGSRYALAEAGASLLARLRSPTRSIMHTWHLVEQEFEEMLQR